MLEIFDLIAPLFGLILIGFVVGRASGLPVASMGMLNTFIIYVALPALIFKLLSGTPIEELTNWRFIGANVGATFVIFATTLLLGLINARGNLGEATIQGFAGAYGNIGYMGPALALLSFGEAAAVPVALIFCFENIMHFTLAPALMAMSGRGAGGFGRLILEVIRRVVTHPFILATAVGVAGAALQVAPPAPIERLIAYLAQAAAPCALFAMGATLALRPLKRTPPALGYIVPMKLIAHPAAMYLALSYFGDFDAAWTFTAVLLAALPTATNVFVIAQQYDVWVERASAAVLVTTAASVATVSALIYAVRTGAFPADLFPGGQFIGW